MAILIVRQRIYLRVMESCTNPIECSNQLKFRQNGAGAFMVLETHHTVKSKVEQVSGSHDAISLHPPSRQQGPRQALWPEFQDLGQHGSTLAVQETFTQYQSQVINGHGTFLKFLTPANNSDPTITTLGGKPWCPSDPRAKLNAEGTGP